MLPSANAEATFLSKGPRVAPSTDLPTSEKKRTTDIKSHHSESVKPEVFLCVFLEKKKCHNFKSKPHCSEESFSTLLQREEAFMWSENTRLIFFSSYETLLFKQPEWIVSVHVLKPHHIHLGMDVLGCWKSGPLVHRATKSPDQQFQNVPFSYIASMHTS